MDLDLILTFPESAFTDRDGHDRDGWCHETDAEYEDMRLARCGQPGAAYDYLRHYEAGLRQQRLERERVPLRYHPVTGEALDICPGTTEDDLLGLPEGFEVSQAVAQRAEILSATLEAHHADGRHPNEGHPFCTGCRGGRAYSSLARRLVLDLRFDPLKIDPNADGWVYADQPQGEEQAKARFDVAFLGDVLERPAAPPERVEGLIPSDSSALIVAQRKTGKTTFMFNYAKALILGDPFLGSLETRPVSGNVAMLNFEVSDAMAARWADEVGVPRDRLILANLRGRTNPLTTPEDRAALGALLRSHDVETLIVDPFGRAFTGKSQNDAAEVTPWLVGLDEFARSEVGATDLLLTAHAGWDGERTRGSTALEDWADVVINLTKDDDGDRYVRAFGRDIDLDEDRLAFNPATRALSLSGSGSRKEAKNTKHMATLAVAACRAVREAGGAVSSISKLEALVRAQDDAPTFRNGEMSKAVAFAKEQGNLKTEGGGQGRPMTIKENR